MGLKDILVHLDDSKGSKARCDAALGLASAHGAHLTGMIAVGEPTMPGYIRHNLPKEALEAQENYLKEMIENACERFEKAAAAWDVPFELRRVRRPETTLAETISLHARHCDLVVMGQEDEEDCASLSRAVVEEVLFSCGRPLLMIPYVGVSRPIGKTVLVAWDGGREATRAVNDALPFMEGADKVVIMTANASADKEGREPGSDISLHLARHGINVDLHHVTTSEVSIGDAILDMGGYGHSRFKELVLGGVTKKILQQMTLPVLMSH